MTSAAPETHPVVSRAEWARAREVLLRKEKDLTRLRDELNRQRLELPRVRVEKNYEFDGHQGKQSLDSLFDGRSQLIIYHFMFWPGWKEGCVGCSFLSESTDAARIHLEHHDVSLAVIPRAPLSEIEPFKQRMGWRFPWLSSNDTDFNYDFHASNATEEISGASAFFKNSSDEIFHTYSTYGRGSEQFITAYQHLDIAPLGRNETGPHHNLIEWVRHHDRYNSGGSVGTNGRYIPEPEPQVAVSKSEACCESHK